MLQDEDYCDKDYPNLAATLRDYIMDVGGLHVFSENADARLQKFFEEQYPDTRAEWPDVKPILSGLYPELQ